MLELKYRNAFKEVDEILKHTDIYLVNEIPKKFIYFWERIWIMITNLMYKKDSV